MIEAGHVEHTLDVRLLRAVEHWGGDRHAVAQVAAELYQFRFLQGPDRLFLAIDLLERVLQRLEVLPGQIGVDRLADALAEARARPAEMRLQDLADIHPARYAQRVEHDVDRRAVRQEWHVLRGHDLRHHALVAVPSGHLVAGLDLALHRDEDLHHLHDAGRQLIAALQLLDLVEEPLLETLLRLVVLAPDRLDLGHQPIVRDGELPPLRPREFLEHRPGDPGVLLQSLRAGDAVLALEQLAETAVDVAIEDRLLVIPVFGEALDFFTLDRERALVLLDAVPVEDADFDDGALNARRHPQRGVADVGGFFAEDRTQQLLLRRHRAFALGG